MADLAVAGASADAPAPPARTFTTWLTDVLRSEILRGDLPAGTRLRQAEVARRFGISTTPVRESFVALQREGLLTQSAHRGVTVFRPTLEDLRENYEIRIALEVLATRLAAPRVADETLAELGALIAEMSATTFADVERYYELNARFHLRLYADAGRPRLERLIATYRQASASYQRLFAVHQPNARETQQQHEAIYAACRARDAMCAAAAMEAHLQTTLAVLVAALEREAGEAA